jgi:hypothetical protein
MERPQEERPGDPDHAEDDRRHAEDDTADLGERRGDGTRRVTVIEQPHRRRTEDLLDLERGPGGNTEREGVSGRWIQAPRSDARRLTLPGDVRRSGHEPGDTRAGSGGNGRLPVSASGGEDERPGWCLRRGLAGSVGRVAAIGPVENRFYLVRAPFPVVWERISAIWERRPFDPIGVPCNGSQPSAT